MAGTRLAFRAAGLALAAGLICAAPAGAAAPKAPVADTDRLVVELVGTINSVCRIDGGLDIDFGELTGNEHAAAALMLDCNVPFDLNIQTRNGGLAHTRQPGGEGPFAGLLPYRVVVTVPTLSPAPGALRGDFRSSDLRAGRSLSSGSAISGGVGSIEFHTEAPRGAGLLAGDYADTVEVTVTSRL